MNRSSALLAALFSFATVACGPLEDGDEGPPSEALDGTSLLAGSAAAIGLMLPSTVTAGATLTGTVRAGSGVVVYLNFPTSIFAGPKYVRTGSQGSATFTLHSNPFLAAPATVTLSARTQSPNPATYVAASVSVVPSPTPPATARPQVASAVLSPATVVSGTSSTFTITLSEPAPDGGAAIQVAISNDFFGKDADVPPVVLVPAGATAASVQVRTHLSNSVATTLTEYVVANSFGGGFQGGALTVNAR
jgi:hypothetical protein